MEPRFKYKKAAQAITVATKPEATGMKPLPWHVKASVDDVATAQQTSAHASTHVDSTTHDVIMLLRKYWKLDYTYPILIAKDGPGVVGFSLRNGLLSLAWWTIASVAKTLSAPHGDRAAALRLTVRTRHDLKYGHLNGFLSEANMDAMEKEIRALFAKARFTHLRARGERNSWWWRDGYDPASVGTTIPWMAGGH